MPLLPGKRNIGKNIRTERAFGKSRAQATAIALNKARKTGANIPKSRFGKKRGIRQHLLRRMKEA